LTVLSAKKNETQIEEKSLKFFPAISLFSLSVFGGEPRAYQDVEPNDGHKGIGHAHGSKIRSTQATHKGDHRQSREVLQQEHENGGS
jgi:hypothetical protein